MERRTLLAAADLDAAFGFLGIANIPVTPHRGDELHDIAVDAQGRILTVAIDFPRELSGLRGFTAVMSRYTTDGAPDASFGVGGKVAVSIDALGSQLRQIASGPGGTVLMAGQDFENDRLVQYRLTSSGAVDTTFGGGDGLVIVPNSDVIVRDLLVLPDGRSIVFSTVTSNGAARFSGFTADGQVDLSFGSAGKIDLSNFQLANDSVVAARAASGSIYIAGAGNSRVQIARLTPGGQLDLSFGGDGIVEGPPGAGHAIAIDSSNRLLVAGALYLADNDFAAWRFASDGTQDLAFGGGDGVFTHDFAGEEPGYAQDYARFVAPLPNGQIVVAGYSAGRYARSAALQLSDSGQLVTTVGNGGIYERRRPGEIYALSSQNMLIAGDSIALIGTVITQFTAAGNIDSSFGVDGSAYVDTSGQLPTIRRMLPLAGGDFLAVGRTITLEGDTDFYVGRFNSDGSYDTSFGGGDGFVTINFSVEPLLSDEAFNLLLLGSGKILVAGDFGKMARLTADGALDPTFGVGGKAIITGLTIAAAAEQGDGRIVLVGESFFAGESFTVARIHATGALDTSFGAGGYFAKSEFFNSDDLSEGASGGSLAIRPSGQIVAAGVAYLDNRPAPVVLQLTSGGQLDSSFNQGKGFHLLRTGPMSQSGGFSDLHLFGDGKVAAAGGFGATSVVARFLSDGRLDSSFGAGGAAEFAPPVAAENYAFRTLFVATDGKLLLSVSGRADADFNRGVFSQLYRLHANGSPDTAFGPGGAIESSSGTLSTFADAAVMADGRIFAVGATDDDLRGAGTAFAALLNGKPSGPRILLQGDGTLAVVGTAEFDTIRITRSGSQIVARLNSTSATFASSSVQRILLLGDQNGDAVSNTINLPATFYSGAGDDMLFGGINTESFFAGSGDDTMDGGLGNDSFDGESGVDRLSYAKRTTPVSVDFPNSTATIGTEIDRFDLIEQAEGGLAGDLLVGYSFVTLYGNGGNDQLSGDDGGFVLFGGDGDDTLSDGEDGLSTLVGEAGNDLLIGKESTLSYKTHTLGVNVRLDDTIVVGPGQSTTDSGTVAAEEFGDAIIGVPREVDRLGGTFLGIIGSKGNDRLVLEGLRLAHLANSSFRGRIDGLAGNDTLTGSIYRDSLFAGDGQDLVYAGQNDLAFGEAGNDTLLGSNGRESLFGDDGNDYIDAAGGDDIARGGFGDDTVLGGDGNDQITGDEGNDRLVGGVGNDHIEGNSGNDQLHGNAGNDSLIGADGDDELLGSDGNDSLDGGLGADRFVGGSGQDTVTYEDRSEDLELSNNNTANDGAAGEGDNISADIEQMTAGSGNDRIIGNGLANTLLGLDGEDTLYGGAGDDLLDGGDERDLLFGQDGNDRLSGGSGPDVIDGGNGIDTLLGGAEKGDEISNVEVI